MKLFEQVKRMSVLGLGLSVAIGLMMLSACGDDDGGGVVDPSAQFVGQYNITGATFVNSTTIIIPITADSTLAVTYGPGSPAGDDALVFVSAGLFDTAPTCGTPTNTGIELKADGTSALVCIGEEVAETPQGTWQYDEATNEVRITVGPPAAAITLTVVIEDILFTGPTLTGTVKNFPLPNDATMPLGATNLQLVEIDLTLIKRN